MAFTKTSIGLTTPKVTSSEPFPRIGEAKDGNVWNGEKWVTQEEWAASQATGSKLPGDSR